MLGGTGSGRTWWQRAVARGFDPPPPPHTPVTLVRSGEIQLDPANLETALPAGGLGVLLPTYVARCGLTAHQTALRHLLDALADVRQARPGLPLTVWLGMQYGPGEQAEALDRLRALTGAGQPDVPVIGFALPGRGKIRTVNTAFQLSRRLGHTGWLWTDDDVEFGPGCLARLVDRFHERGCTGAVGAHMVALPRATAAARTMDRVSGITVPPGAYPAAACMLVAGDVVADGIPVRRLADDGHVLFELLDPDAADPLHDLEVLPDARGAFYRVSGTYDTLRRLRRSLYSHVTCAADYPWPTARTYLTGTLFHGLWPLTAWDNSGGPVRGLKRWTVKAVHLTWFCCVAAGLAARGATGRPLRHVPWGDDGDFMSPAAEARPAAAHTGR
ncbi:glycosyltransferase family 2 protein [Streptomyces sp. NPDC091280]|uniref:glycosyltransferase family 2 protein n=1 Tax=Streptomyces sp. NPDC091280 TaxID=3365984 RepID=UPI0037FA686B